MCIAIGDLSVKIGLLFDSSWAALLDYFLSHWLKGCLVGAGLVSLRDTYT